MSSNTPNNSSLNCTPISEKKKVFKPPVKSFQHLPFTPSTLPKAPLSKVEKGSIEDKQLANKMRLLNNELASQINSYRRTTSQLQQAIKIVRNYEQEDKTLRLIDKWRGISQGGMSYMLNSTLLKISRLGGYEELKRKEVEAEKRKIEYQVDDRLQDEMDSVLESEEFKMLAGEEQEEYKNRMQDKIDEAETWKEKELSKLDEKVKASANQEMTMEELSRRLKVDYDLVFPE